MRRLNCSGFFVEFPSMREAETGVVCKPFAVSSLAGGRLERYVVYNFLFYNAFFIDSEKPRVFKTCIIFLE